MVLFSKKLVITCHFKKGMEKVISNNWLTWGICFSDAFVLCGCKIDTFIICCDCTLLTSYKTLCGIVMKLYVIVGLRMTFAVVTVLFVLKNLASRCYRK